MSAGLPHFTTHHMRVWGRDVFISFRGLLLQTGRYSIAKQHLVAFAGCLYHGLIPNLLDSGRRPRYNARDATWYFLQALQDYWRMSPDGTELLQWEVPMRFNNDIYTDFDDPAIYTNTRKMYEIVDSILEAHCAGIEFTEWNAGYKLDHAMRPEGFHVTAGIEPATGFVYGGNAWNCGTWMDKMGESSRAGNAGVPATPRDGSAIELTALLASACKWLGEIAEWKGWAYQMEDGSKRSLTEIHGLIASSFECHFYIPEDTSQGNDFAVNAALVSRRGIYKDTVGASNTSSDYQLRPNFLTAMRIAPHLFDLHHARHALKMAEKHLMGPLGMRTLDPEDPNYRPRYSHVVRGEMRKTGGHRWATWEAWVQAR